ncbi:MAG: nucleoside-triphosphatase [Bacteroidota bacterium]
MEKNRAIYKLSPLWQLSIIGGSIWGALEITLGSALHNLMVPLVAGTLLAFLGVFTVSVISANSIRRGFFWRAALICALLKSVSPSAVILPPMVGIMIEGLLMEFGVLVLGTNAFGLALGGGLAMLSIPLFKAIRLFMLYGQGIVDFFMGLISQLSNSNTIIITSSLIYTVLIIYLILGVLSALIGFSLGKKNSTFSSSQIELTIFGEKGGKIDFRNYFLLIIHLVALILFLTYASAIPIAIAILSGGVYALLVILFYERPRRMVLKPFFVAPVMLFSFIIPFFTTQIALVPVYGIYIFVRAIFVVATLAAIGTELAKPAVSQFFNRGFFSPVYYASSMAFNALPIYLNVFKNINFSAANALNDIQGVIRNSSWGGNRPIIIITGGLGEGKTTYLENLINILGRVKNIRIKGFIAKGIGLPPLRKGYSLKVLPDGNELVLCRRIAACGLPNKSFEFNQEVIKELTHELIAIKGDEILVVDEVGRMELYGEVWAELIEHHLTKTKNVLVFTVRRENLMHIADRWNLNDAFVFDIAKTSAEVAANSIKDLVLSYNSSGSR